MTYGSSHATVNLTPFTNRSPSGSIPLDAAAAETLKSGAKSSIVPVHDAMSLPKDRYVGRVVGGETESAYQG